VELTFRSVALRTRAPFVTAHTASPVGGARRRIRALLARSELARQLAHELWMRVRPWRVLEVRLRAGGVSVFGEAAPSERRGESIASASAFLARARTALEGAAPETADVARRLGELQPGERAARAAIDAALHDLQGKLAGQPVWRMLGLRQHGPPTSYTIFLDDPDAMARAAEAAQGRFRTLKLKLGGRDALDAERVRAVRGATRLPLGVDVNEGWTLEEALETIPPLARLGVEMVEQPLPAGDPGGPRLKAASPLPIFLDEDCLASADLPACAERGHGVNVKLSKCGGLGEALRLVASARELGLGLMIGARPESGLGIAAAAQLASLFDRADLDANLLLARDPWRGVELVDGVQVPADRPGLGVRPAGRGRRES
jgi:L-alanine-DL-glutamate epimerase-like enolase superfamily enzyme